MSGAGRRFSTWNRAFSSQPSRRGSPNGRVGDPPTGIRGRAARSTCSPALRPVSEAAGGGGVPQDPSEGNPVTGSHPTPRSRCVAGAPLAGSSPDREPMRALRRSGSRLHGGPGCPASRRGCCSTCAQLTMAHSCATTSANGRCGADRGRRRADDSPRFRARRGAARVLGRCLSPDVSGAAYCFCSTRVVHSEWRRRSSCSSRSARPSGR